MDQSSDHRSQDPRPQPQTQGPRDMMFCHECHDEWYRDEHGLTCPECGSDFTEIIEENNDPRDHGHSDDESTPSLDDIPPHLHPFRDHNPWRADGDDDPDEGDIRNVHYRQMGPGGLAVTSTIFRTVSPAGRGGVGGGGGGGNAAPGVIGPFASLLSGILGGARGPSQNYENHDDQGNQANQSPERQGTPGSGSGTTPGGHRFTYTAGVRLYPRDSEHPGPHLEPVDELNNVLVGLMAAFGEPPDPQHDDHYHGAPGQPPRAVALNPLMAIFSQMMAGNGQVGDAVYSQEALDRIITQLMEQNASSNAPGPASQDDIASLPRKPVTVDMLGFEGHAECSICMEEVHIGEEVTELPCHHWFHHACVAAWLGEHDTCPHCRKGIAKPPENSGNPASGSSERPMQVPGAFDAGGESTSGNARHSGSQARSSSTDEPHSGGGLGERLRRGWFGP